jgi:hypothetical protein
MIAIDRRNMLAGILCGAAVVTFGMAVAPKVAQSMPLAIAKAPVGTTEGAPALEPEGLVREARVVVADPRHHRHHRRHRHRRRWVCWWRRGRRVCGWRW